MKKAVNYKKISLKFKTMSSICEAISELQGDSAKCAQILFLVLCTCISSIINFQLLTFQFLII